MTLKVQYVLILCKKVANACFCGKIKHVDSIIFISMFFDERSDAI